MLKVAVCGNSIVGFMSVSLTYTLITVSAVFLATFLQISHASTCQNCTADARFAKASICTAVLATKPTLRQLSQCSSRKASTRRLCSLPPTRRLGPVQPKSRRLDEPRQLVPICLQKRIALCLIYSLEDLAWNLGHTGILSLDTVLDTCTSHLCVYNPLSVCIYVCVCGGMHMGPCIYVRTPRPYIPKYNHFCLFSDGLKGETWPRLELLGLPARGPGHPCKDIVAAGMGA